MSLPMNPLAQVVHAKSRLSATGEYVPTPREFEHALRDVGCSLRVAKRIMSKVYDDEGRDVPIAEPEANEERDVLEALQAIEDLAIARQIENMVARSKRA